MYIIHNMRKIAWMFSWLLASGWIYQFAQFAHWMFFLFLNFWILFYFFIQQVLISHQFCTHQCIHVNPNRPIHHTTTPPPSRFPPLVSIRLFSTSVSLFLHCKPVHMHHFSRFHIYALYPGECSVCPWEETVICCFRMECPVNIN